MKRRPSQIPPGSWPPRMMADLAAGYCGEKHVDDFLERVGSVYPAPRVEDSRRRRFWYREDLDRSLGLSGAADDFASRTRAKLQAMREKRESENGGLEADIRLRTREKLRRRREAPDE